MLRHQEFDFLLGTRKSLGIWFIDWDLELLLKVAFNSLFSCEIVREGPLEAVHLTIWVFVLSDLNVSFSINQSQALLLLCFCDWSRDMNQRRFGSWKFISVQSVRDIHSLSLIKSKNIGLNYFLALFSFWSLKDALMSWPMVTHLSCT